MEASLQENKINKQKTPTTKQKQKKRKERKKESFIYEWPMVNLFSSVEEIVLPPQTLGIHYSWKVVVSVSLPCCGIQQHRRQWNKRKLKRETWSSSFYCGTSESKSLKPVFVFCASNARWTFRELQLSLCLLTDFFFLESDMEHKKVKYHSNARWTFRENYSFLSTCWLIFFLSGVGYGTRYLKIGVVGVGV